MKVYSLVREQTVRAPLPTTWAFFSNPVNLREITPPEMDFTIRTPDLPSEIYAGLFVEYRLRPLAGIPVTWVTEITHVVPQQLFCDEQRIGPYRIWSHKHFFRKAGKNTHMIDRVDYALPPLPFSALVHKHIIRRKLEYIFAHRHAAIEQVFR